MKGKAFLAAMAVVGLLSGCTTYKVGAMFEEGGQPYYGDVMVMIGDAGEITLTSEDGKIECKGATQVTQRPSMFTTLGGRGHAEGRCTDGRTFKVDFVQTRERGGNGRGITGDGKVVRVFFDTSMEVIRSEMKLDNLKNLVK